MRPETGKEVSLLFNKMAPKICGIVAHDFFVMLTTFFAPFRMEGMSGSKEINQNHLKGGESCKEKENEETSTQA